MKTDKLNNKYTPKEQVDSFVFRTKLSSKETKDSVDQLNQARKNKKEQLSESQALYARVKQLQFQMEDYAKSEVYKEELNFANFLRKYIRLRYKIQKDFAKDIRISPTELSSILTNGRPPGKKMIVRLELHSNNAIPAVSWYKLWEKQKEHELKTDKNIRIQEQKNVQNRLVYDF